MEYQNYEEYMRKVLGYSSQNPNIYENYQYRNTPQIYDNTYYRNEYVVGLSEEEARELYPEIYHLVNPMICKACETNSEPISKELIERMTDEVYNSIEAQETIVNVRIETSPKDTKNTSTTIKRDESNRGDRVSRKSEESKITSLNRENRSNKERESNSTSKTTRESIISKENMEVRETRQQNTSLRDLIKILILEQLIGGNRPPVRPPRPPYPGGPGMPPPTRPPYSGGRAPIGEANNSPIIPRDYEDYLKF